MEPLSDGNITPPASEVFRGHANFQHDRDADDYAEVTQHANAPDVAVPQLADPPVRTARRPQPHVTQRVIHDQVWTTDRLLGERSWIGHLPPSSDARTIAPMESVRPSVTRNVPDDWDEGRSFDRFNEASIPPIIEPEGIRV